MAANPKKGRHGGLHTPQKRLAQLQRYAHLSLGDAGKLMGIGVERARQLYRLYGIERAPIKIRRWSKRLPTRGWWFMRWSTESSHWFVVEIFDDTVNVKGLHPRTTKQAAKEGAQWLGPLSPPA